mgnify:CR=1 FL=1
MPVPGTNSRPFVDVFDPDANLNLDDTEGCCCYFNMITCYVIHELIIDPDATNTKALTPDNGTQDDIYGLNSVFNLIMPDPEQKTESVHMLTSSWEFLASISSLIAVPPLNVPWWAWRFCPEKNCKNLNNTMTCLCSPSRPRTFPFCFKTLRCIAWILLDPSEPLKSPKTKSVIFTRSHLRRTIPCGLSGCDFFESVLDFGLKTYL